MTWRQLEDPANIENKNAGNGGDLVKHTVYLAVLDHLLSHLPWANGLRVRECHAGRGMYCIPDSDNRRPCLEYLYDPVDADVSVLLHDVQRASQIALGVWPPTRQAFGWYAGSAVLNAWRLGCAKAGKHLLELYEQAPETRKILRAVFADPGLCFPQVEVRILPVPEVEQEFDGELHIADNISNWDSRDLVLLDPFGIWREKTELLRRNQYHRIISGLVTQGQESPMLILFWTWGRDYQGDLEETGPPVPNGYQELRSLLHHGKRRFILVTWCWGIQFAMWVIMPDSHLNALCAVLQQRCDEILGHLEQHGYEGRQTYLNIEVRID